MKYFRASLLVVKSLIFMFGNRDKDKQTQTQQSGVDKIGTIILKHDIHNAF